MTMDSSPQSCFHRDRHVQALVSMLDKLPCDYQEQDSHRLTLAYFVISGLDILNALDQVDTNRVIDWVYHLQVLPSDEGEDQHGIFYGFRGSSSMHIAKDARGVISNNGGHLASTYCALSILRIIGDDLSSIDNKRMIKSMKILQQPNGSFMCLHTGAETDLRFVFCAVAISFIFNDWSGMDMHKTVSYILECQSYDGGFGLSPGLESHGGATYCAIASLKLMGYITVDPVSGRPTSSVVDLASLVEWCVQKQTVDGGFQGRPNKDSDTCYAFWVGGLLKLVGGDHLYDSEALHGFLLTCQSEYGGFGKWPGYTNFDQARDIDDRKSTVSYVFSFGSSPIIWQSKKMNTLALSTIEAKYRVLVKVGKEALWIKYFMEEIGFPL